MRFTASPGTHNNVEFEPRPLPAQNSNFLTKEQLSRLPTFIVGRKDLQLDYTRKSGVDVKNEKGGFIGSVNFMTSERGQGQRQDTNTDEDKETRNGNLAFRKSTGVNENGLEVQFAGESEHESGHESVPESNGHTSVFGSIVDDNFVIDIGEKNGNKSPRPFFLLSPQARKSVSIPAQDVGIIKRARSLVDFQSVINCSTVYLPHSGHVNRMRSEAAAAERNLILCDRNKSKLSHFSILALGEERGYIRGSLGQRLQPRCLENRASNVYFEPTVGDLNSSGSGNGKCIIDSAVRVRAKSESHIMLNDSAAQTLVCAICLEDIDIGTRVRLLPCGHMYHVECIDTWLLKRSTTCPYCKFDIQKDMHEKKVANNNNNSSYSGERVNQLPDSDSASESTQNINIHLWLRRPVRYAKNTWKFLKGCAAWVKEKFTTYMVAQPLF